MIEEKTLENRPYGDSKKLYYQNRQEYDEWFEGFIKQEKEKQKIDLKWARKTTEVNKQRWLNSFIQKERYAEGFLMGYLVRGKEILGKQK